jgi:hypothetical protein
MSTIRLPLAVLLALSLAVAGCGNSQEDARVAELQKQLDAAKQELAAKTEGAAAAATAATDAAHQAATAAGDAASNAAAAGAVTEQALTEQNRALAAQSRALEEQRAESARQAEENARLKREVEAMTPREFTLPAGTIIPVRTTAELSTKSVSNGSVFDALLETDLVVDGTTLAKAGSRVTCVVVSSDPGGRVKGVASLDVAARSIAAVNGATLNVKTHSYGVEAGSTRGRDAKRTGIATGAGAVIGAIAGGGRGAAIGAGAGAAAGVGATMATRGQPAVIPAETLIEFGLAAPATVVIRK